MNNFSHSKAELSISRSDHTYFMFSGRKLLYADNTINLTIEWQTPLPSKEVFDKAVKDNAIFTEEERAYYSDKIVKDIYVRRTREGN